jgi:hypothetical protein
MPEYRAYIVDSDGHFIRPIQLACSNDECAKEYAKQLVDGHGVELWQEDRQVAKFDRKPE